MSEEISRFAAAALPMPARGSAAPAWFRARSGALAVLTCGLACAGWTLGTTMPAAAASTQLSDGQPFSDIDFGSTLPQISPNGHYAVYRQDAVTDGASELWSVALAGGAPVRLSDVLAPGQFVTFAISPDSSRVVYTVDQDIAGRIELYSIPIDGHLAPTKLNPSLSADRNVLDFLISPTSDRVFYRADQRTDQDYELFSVPIAGGAAVRLNADLPFDFDVEAYRVNPAGTTVVYRAGRDSIGFWQLWAVPAVGLPDSAAKISRTLCAIGCDVDPYFQISPDGTRVIYRADTTATEAYDLWSVLIGGGVSTRLNGPLTAGGSVDDGFLLSADGQRVVYRADQAAAFVDELYSVPLTGGIATRLSGDLASGGDVATGFLVSPDSSTVVYRADEEVNDVEELYSVSIAGGSPTKLDGALVGGGDVLDFAISPDSARVVYRADQNVDTLNELFSVPIGGGLATKLNRTLVSGGDVQNYRVSPDSHWVVYGADQDVDGVDKLLRAPTAGGPVQNVNGQLVGGGHVVLASIGRAAYEISPANSFDVLYAADEVVNDEIELFLSGPPDASPGDCTPSATTLCLQGRLFAVSVNWRDFQGHTGQGQATPLSSQSGDFWFFGPDSNEMIVKIIDGCDNNGRFWVSWRALSNVEMDLTIRNTDTHQILTYHNPLAFVPNGHLDIDTIFHCDGTGPATQHYDTSTDLPAPGIPQLVEYQDPALIGPCLPAGDSAICLKSGRFRVEGTWRDFTGQSGTAHMIKKNEASGYAWFFNGDSYELLFKVNDGCGYNGNTWVFVAGLTNVEATFTITDKWTGAVYRQENGLGVDFPTNLDIDTNLTYCGPHPSTPEAPASTGPER